MFVKNWNLCYIVKVNWKKISTLSVIVVCTLGFLGLSHLFIEYDGIYDTDAQATVGFTNIWENINYQGLGFVTGLVTHPQDSSIMYARTDVGGIYKYDFNSSRWKNLTDMFTPFDDVQNDVESIGLDYTNPNKIYAMMGTGENGTLLVSHNQGQSWIVKPAFLNGDRLRIEGNSDTFRGGGERLFVDRNNPSTLYYGSRFNGLLRSTDEGTTWENVDIGTSTINHKGVSWVIGNSSQLFIGVPERGIYASTNGGFFQQIRSITDTAYPYRVQLTNNYLYTSLTSFLDNEGGLLKYNLSNGQWTDISPDGTKPVTAFVVSDDDNSLHLTYWNRGDSSNNVIYSSNDAGENWTQLQSDFVVPAWYNQQRPIENQYDSTWYIYHDFFFYSSMIFNPQNPNGVLFGNGWGVFSTDNIYATPRVNWNTQMAGFEEFVVNRVLKVPNGPLMSAVMDGGILISDNDQNIRPFRVGTNDYVNMFNSISYAKSDPRVIMALGNTQKFTPDLAYLLKGQIVRSEDGGQTWQAIETPEEYAHSGNIAISSSDPNKAVILMRRTYPVNSWNGSAWRTDNAGATWEPVNGIPEGNMLQIFDFSTIALVSDKINGDIFYHYQCSPSTGWQRNIYRSIDGGENFSLRNTDNYQLPCVGDVYLEANNYSEGDLWLAPTNQDDQTRRLWRSKDGGETWNTITGITDVALVSIGAPFQPEDIGTVYVLGSVNDNWGVYMSRNAITDEDNAQWERVSPLSLGMNKVFSLDADTEEFGKVYIGTGGRGSWVGRISLMNTTDTTTTTTANTASNATSSTTGVATTNNTSGMTAGSSTSTNSSPLSNQIRQDLLIPTGGYNYQRLRFSIVLMVVSLMLTCISFLYQFDSEGRNFDKK